MQKKEIFVFILVLLACNLICMKAEAAEFREIIDENKSININEDILDNSDEKEINNDFAIDNSADVIIEEAVKKHNEDNVDESTKEKNEDLENNSVDNVVIEDIPQIERTTGPTMLYASQIGYLPQTGQYSLYPLDLKGGDYLQARLTPPNDYEIDYDLRLYDSSFNLLTYSDYITTMREDSRTVEESIGYIADRDMGVYILVISEFGGSLDKSFCLDIAVTTNLKDGMESDEVASGAAELKFDNYATASISRNLNSPLDNDWYTFIVEDTPAFDRMRLYLDNSSSNNAKVEIYKNVSQNSRHYGLLKVGEGNGGELNLKLGKYYLRVISTNSLDSFNIYNIGSYKLSIEPVGRVDLIEITYIDGYNRAFVNYPEGGHARIDEIDPSYVTVTGVTYYIDQYGVKKVAPNAKVNGLVTNNAWMSIDRQDMAYTNGHAASNNTGLFRATIPLLSGIGASSNIQNVSVHYYDVLDVKISSADDLDVFGMERFYLLKRTSYIPH
ncbi:MAG: hypothetical protein K5769_01350 [Pseudobutyrivibrio sp.]|nr:hypothetical protein [Pseudobutyrivibrio sp.]